MGHRSHSLTDTKYTANFKHVKLGHYEVYCGTRVPIKHEIQLLPLQPSLLGNYAFVKFINFILTVLQKERPEALFSVVL